MTTLLFGVAVLAYLLVILAVGGAGVFVAGRWAWSELRRWIPAPAATMIMIPAGFVILLFVWLPFSLFWGPIVLVKRLRSDRHWSALLLPLFVTFGATGMLVASFLAGLNGGSIDPTDPSNFDHFAFVNDLPAPVWVAECADDPCTQTYDSGLFVPFHKSISEQVAWGDSEPQGFRVESSNRWVLGCIWLTARRKLASTEIVRISTIRGCMRDKLKT